MQDKKQTNRTGSQISFIKPDAFIGKVGFDNVNLSFLWRREEPYSVPLINDPFVRKNIFSEKTYTIIDHDIMVPGHNITITQKKVVVYGGFYKFVFGNYASHPISYLKISASDENAPNLKNMSIGEIRNDVNFIVMDLQESYGISLHIDKSSMRMTQAEINKTVITDHPFRDYEPILEFLTQTNLDEEDSESGNGGTTTGIYRNTKDQSLETYNLITPTKDHELIVYDKNLELKKNHHTDSGNTYLLRQELKLKREQALIKLFPKNFYEKRPNCCIFADLTQEMVNTYFYDAMAKRFQKADDYLHGIQSNNQCAPILRVILNVALKRALEVEGWTTTCEILDRCSKENILLDPRNLIAYLNQLTKSENSPMSELNLNCLSSLTDKITACPSRFELSSRSSIGIQNLYDELKHKFTKQSIVYPFVAMNNSHIFYLNISGCNRLDTPLPDELSSEKRQTLSENELDSMDLNQDRGFSVLKPTQPQPAPNDPFSKYWWSIWKTHHKDPVVFLMRLTVSYTPDPEIVYIPEKKAFYKRKPNGNASSVLSDCEAKYYLVSAALLQKIKSMMDTEPELHE